MGLSSDQLNVTILNLIQRMEKIVSVLKNARFSGKGRQSLHTCIYVMRICKMLISYVKLDHTLYSINYGIVSVKLSS